jgi:hypothetical protein
MKPKLSIALLFVLYIALLSLPSCSKDTTTVKNDTVVVNDTLLKNDTVTTYPITGLWSGYFTDSAYERYNFSFSINSDGTATCTTIDNINTFEYETYGGGKWVLNNDTFYFYGKTINAYGGIQDTLNASAIYDSTKGTLTNGSFTPGDTTNYIWTMNKVY